jgi:hypothetical protein
MLRKNGVVAYLNAQLERLSRMIDGKCETRVKVTGPFYYHYCYHYHLQLGHVVLRCVHHFYDSQDVTVNFKRIWYMSSAYTYRKGNSTLCIKRCLIFLHLQNYSCYDNGYTCNIYYYYYYYYIIIITIFILLLVLVASSLSTML